MWAPSLKRGDQDRPRVDLNSFRGLLGVGSRKRWNMPGNYERAVGELIRGGWLDFPRGSLARLTVSHDDECGVMRGLTTCDCSPEFSVELLDFNAHGTA